ncbi:MAG: peptidoglycan-binding protein [Phormidesmis sp.]
MPVQSQSVQSPSIQSKTTASATFQSQPTLRIGDSGSAVEDLQQQLSAYVSPISVDGVFGLQTHHAVHAFQYSMFLLEDGVAEPATWASLVSGLPATLPALALGSRGQEVVWVQEILANLGVYRSVGLGSLVDGVYGSATAQAVRRYQADQQLFSADGVVGPVTWMTLAGDRLRAANYDILGIQLINQQKEHTGSVSAIATTRDVRFIFTGSSDTLVQRWDEQGNKAAEPDAGDGCAVSDVAIKSSTLEVVSSTFGGTIRTSDFRQTTDSRENRFPGRGGSVRAIDISVSGKVIAAGNTDQSLRLFDSKGELLSEMTLHEDDVTGVAFNPRRERFAGQVVSVDTAQKVVVSEGATDIGDPVLQPALILSGASTGVFKSSVAISHSGYYIAIAGGPTLRIFSVLGGLLYSTNYSVALNDVAFSPCGRYLALACGDSFVRVLDLFPATAGADIFAPVYALAGHSQNVTSVAFAHDSEYLYSGDADGELFTWKIER